MKPYLLRYVILLSILVCSCGRGASDQPQQSKQFEVYRDQFFNSLHEPDQLIAELVPGAGSFDSSLVNDPHSFTAYANNDIKAALNLGVYLSDLNYCYLHGKNVEGRLSFESAIELGKATGLEHTALNYLLSRYNKHINENDSLKSVIASMLGEATLKLKGTEKERLAGMAIAGYRVENLHFVVATLKNIPVSPSEEQLATREHLLQYILNQRTEWETLYNFINSHADPLDPDRNPNYPFFNNALRQLIELFRRMSASEYHLDELENQITAIRNRIVAE